MADEDVVEALQEQDEAELDEFQIEIQKVTNFVKDPEKAKKEEETELNNTEETTTTTTMPYTPTMTSTDLSVSYSDISDDNPYIHGAHLSSPKAQFAETAIPTVVEIHELLTTRDQTLFFIADSDDDDDDDTNCNHSDSDLILNDEELSEQRKTNDQLHVIQENQLSKKRNHKKHTSMKKKKKKKKKRTSKLQKSLSERGLTFAISEGHVYFNWSAFIREYLYNFFHILALPIIVYMENKTGATSRLYWPCDWNLYGYFALLQVFGFFYMNILYFGWISDGMDYSLAILVYDVLYLSRITVVAIKWAYLPPQIFPMMRKKKLTSEQFAMIHLLTGWVNHKNKTGLAREIGQCCARLELDINCLQFSFRDERRQTLKSNNLCLTRRCSTYITYGNLLIPYVVFCASRHVAKWSYFIRLTAWIISPIICMCPLAARMVQFPSFHEFKTNVGIYGSIWYMIFWMTTSMNLCTLILFCAVIALDFKRRYQFIRFCTRLIELKKNAFKGFVNYTDYKEHLFPQCVESKEGRKMLESAVIQTLDLSDAQTMYNWSLLRSFFLDFGLRFLRREEAILGYFTLSILLIVAFYITMLYLNILIPNYWETAFVVMSSFAVLTPAFAALRYATRINQKVAEQRSILADKRLRLENEIHSVDEEKIREMNTMRAMEMNMDHDHDDNNNNDEEKEKEIEQQIEATAASIQRAADMLEKIVKMLEVDRFRIRLLGYSVDTTVTGIIAAVVGTVGFLVARLLLGERAEGLPDT